MIESYIIESPIGLLKIREENNKITNLSLCQKGVDTEMLKDNPHSDLLWEAHRQIDEYFTGNRTKFDLPLHLTGTPFQQQVWDTLQKIPYGETWCYEDVALQIGNKKAVRAVGQANNKNPILIIVPCHRVIHKNGDISGFACGVDAKKYLLDLEKTLTLKTFPQ